MSNTSWRERLQEQIPAQWRDEIDAFENQMELRKQRKIEERVFAEVRLRRGAYGQRYDNGRRHDGVVAREIVYPQADLTKGPDTLWDAPGMQRIKIPFGLLRADQLEAIAECAEEYSDAILHVTTRQDIQLHYVHIEDSADLQRRLAAVGVTTREACGNSVRNVTGCPLAGICRDEAFDISSYARAEAFFLLGHRDVQDFGRKFKIAYSGCEQHPCGLVTIHDLGLVAKTRTVGGKEERGFRVVVGGGLGPVPHLAKELYDFLPESEMLPMSQAVSRVYARLGEKKNRNKARIKFLVAKLGIDEFKRLVDEERKVLEADPRWTEWLRDAHEPLVEYHPSPVTDGKAEPAAGFDKWRSTNVYEQRQEGFVAVSITLPLGDMTSAQARTLAAMTRRYTRDALRTTVEQNLLLRWVHTQDLVAVYNELAAIGLDLPGAASIVDVVTCPGTDTCKLGVASSRGLAAELRTRLYARQLEHDANLRDLRIKVSGCPNSCGQHHVADIGFYGSSRNIGPYRVPHFQVILGGEWQNNGGSYGLALGAVPSKRIPDAVDVLLQKYLEGREGSEAFHQWVGRAGKKAVKDLLSPLTAVPAHDAQPDYYVDWHDVREYTIGDIGVGECAGEVVSLTEFSLVEAESLAFDASVLLDEAGNGDQGQKAADLAYTAMIRAAQGLLKVEDPDVKADPAVVLPLFRQRFLDNERFFDRFVGRQESAYLTAAAESGGKVRDFDEAHRRVEEAQLFIEACHACYARMLETKKVGPLTGAGVEA
jgi:sulfite reductase (ferredoxin)